MSAADARMLVRPTFRRDVIVLCLMMFAFTAFQGLVNALVPLRLAALALSETTVGLIQAIPGVSALLLGPPLARVANTRWRKTAMIANFAFCAIACLLYSRATGVPGLVIPQFMLGLVSAIFWPFALTTSFQVAIGPQQSQVQAYITASQGVGYFLGPIAGGALGEIAPAYSFYGGAIAALIGLAVTTVLSPSQDIEPSQDLLHDLAGAYGRFFRVLTRQPTVLVGSGFVFLAIFLMYVMGGSFFMLYAYGAGLTVFLAASLAGVRDLIGSLVRLSFGAATRRLHPVILVGGGVILASLTLATLPLATTAWGVALVGLALGVGLAYMPPAVNMIAGASAAPEDQPFAIVSLNLSNFTAQTTLAPLLGFLLSVAGYRVAYPIAGVFWAALTGVALVIGMRVVREKSGS
jgi:predicted MFS family arabinose efflux permease